MLADLCAGYSTQELAVIRDFIARFHQGAWEEIRQLREGGGYAEPAKDQGGAALGQIPLKGRIVPDGKSIHVLGGVIGRAAPGTGRVAQVGTSLTPDQSLTFVPLRTLILFSLASTPQLS